MSAFLIPHLFANDVNLSAADLDACFQYVRDYVNGVLAQGGIDATNIAAAMKFSGSQIAQNRGVSVLNFGIAGGEWTGASGTNASVAIRRFFTPPQPVEIVGVRVNVKTRFSGTVTPAQFAFGVFAANAQLLSPPNFPATTAQGQNPAQLVTAAGGFAGVYDDTQQQNWGDYRPPIPGRALAIGKSATCYVMTWIPAYFGNTLSPDFVVVSLKLATPHVVN